MLNSITTSVTVGGEEIHNVINALEQTMMDKEVSKRNAVIACIAIALSIQYPDITPEDRVEGVKDISNYICLWIDNKLDEINVEGLTIN